MSLVPIELTYEQLFRLYGGDRYNKPYPVTDELFVTTPSGRTRVLDVVKKDKHPLVGLIFPGDIVVECSEKHLFSSAGQPVLAEDCTEVDLADGSSLPVLEKYPIAEEDVFDIAVAPPHWYISDPHTGIVHHNTFFLLNVVKSHLDSDPRALALLWDAEFAFDTEQLKSRGIDTKRVIVFPVETVQEFRKQILGVIKGIEETPEKDRIPIIFGLDSLGMLSTTKEMEDSTAGKETRDMTRSQIIKSVFRTITLKIGKINSPLIMNNHLYAKIGGMFPENEMAGGNGLKYAASIIIMLSKRKEKDGTDVIGNIIHCKQWKGRLTKENKVVDTLLNYATGLNRYYGLDTLALKHGVFKQVSTKIELPNGQKVFASQLVKEPEKYYTKEILDAIDQAAAKEFLYGNEFDYTQDTPEETPVESEATADGTETNTDATQVAGTE